MPPPPSVESMDKKAAADLELGFNGDPADELEDDGLNDSFYISTNDALTVISCKNDFDSSVWNIDPSMSDEVATATSGSSATLLSDLAKHNRGRDRQRKQQQFSSSSCHVRRSFTPPSNQVASSSISKSYHSRSTAISPTPSRDKVTPLSYTTPRKIASPMSKSCHGRSITPSKSPPTITKQWASSSYHGRSYLTTPTTPCKKPTIQMVVSPRRPLISNSCHTRMMTTTITPSKASLEMMLLSPTKSNKSSTASNHLQQYLSSSKSPDRLSNSNRSSHQQRSVSPSMFSTRSAPSPVPSLASTIVSSSSSSSSISSHHCRSSGSPALASSSPGNSVMSSSTSSHHHRRRTHSMSPSSIRSRKSIVQSPPAPSSSHQPSPRRARRPSQSHASKSRFSTSIKDPDRKVSSTSSSHHERSGNNPERLRHPTAKSRSKSRSSHDRSKACLSTDDRSKSPSLRDHHTMSPSHHDRHRGSQRRGRRPSSSKSKSRSLSNERISSSHRRHRSTSSSSPRQHGRPKEGGSGSSSQHSRHERHNQERIIPPVPSLNDSLSQILVASSSLAEAAEILIRKEQQDLWNTNQKKEKKNPRRSKSLDSSLTAAIDAVIAAINGSRSNDDNSNHSSHRRRKKSGRNIRSRSTDNSSTHRRSSSRSKSKSRSTMRKKQQQTLSSSADNNERDSTIAGQPILDEVCKILNLEL